MQIELPVTLGVTSVLGLLYIVLTFRVIQARWQNRVSLGDGGQSDLVKRIRTHGNFIEYVPLLLIFLALFEISGVDKTVLASCGAALIAVRIFHIVGIALKPPNIFRIIGTAGTLSLIIAASIYGLMLSIG